LGGIERLDAVGASIAVQARPARRQSAAWGFDRPAAEPTASADRHRAVRPAQGAATASSASTRPAASTAVQAGRPACRQVSAERLDGPAAPPQATDRHCGQATARRPLKSKIEKSKSIARARGRATKGKVWR